MDAPKGTDGRNKTVGPAACHGSCVPKPPIGMHALGAFRAKTLQVHLAKDLREIGLNASQNSKLGRLPDLLSAGKIEVVDSVAVPCPRETCQRVLVSRQHLGEFAFTGGVHYDLQPGPMTTAKPGVQFLVWKVFRSHRVRPIPVGLVQAPSRSRPTST